LLFFCKWKAANQANLALPTSKGELFYNDAFVTYM
jgi:hypothetical protein